MSQLCYIPEGYHAVTAAINMPGAAAAMDWYKTVLNAQEKIRLIDKAGIVVHAEIEIDGSRIMIAEEHPIITAVPKHFAVLQWYLAYMLPRLMKQ